jgi:hypothetical protein
MKLLVNPNAESENLNSISSVSRSHAFEIEIISDSVQSLKIQPQVSLINSNAVAQANHEAQCSSNRDEKSSSDEAIISLKENGSEFAQPTSKDSSHYESLP